MISNDMEIVANRLSFTRLYPSRYSLRSSESASFCKGWQDNLHMSIELESKYAVVSLTISGVVHTLFESDESENVYESADYLVDMSEWNTNSGMAIITSKLFEISYFFEARQKCLSRIELWANEKWIVLNVKCNNGRVSTIESDDGSISIRFSYSQSGCLTAINKFMKDDGGRTESVLYEYDNQKRLISAVGPHFAHKMTYDWSNNLRSLNEQGRFEYSLSYLGEQGVVLKSLDKLDLERSQLVLSYEFKLHDNGFIEISDQISGNVIRKLFDFDGRLIFTSQNDARPIKVISNLVSSDSAILEGGQVITRIEIYSFHLCKFILLICLSLRCIKVKYTTLSLKAC